MRHDDMTTGPCGLAIEGGNPSTTYYELHTLYREEVQSAALQPRQPPSSKRLSQPPVELLFSSWRAEALQGVLGLPSVPGISQNEGRDVVNYYKAGSFHHGAPIADLLQYARLDGHSAVYP